MKKYRVIIEYPKEDSREYTFDSEWYRDDRAHDDCNENIFSYVRRITDLFESLNKDHLNKMYVNGVEVWNIKDGLMLSEEWLKAELAFNLKNSDYYECK